MQLSRWVVGGWCISVGSTKQRPPLVDANNFYFIQFHLCLCYGIANSSVSLMMFSSTLKRNREKKPRNAPLRKKIPGKFKIFTYWPNFNQFIMILKVLQINNFPENVNFAY